MPKHSSLHLVIKTTVESSRPSIIHFKERRKVKSEDQVQGGTQICLSAQITGHTPQGKKTITLSGKKGYGNALAVLSIDK